jgi:hypothetical protein
VAEKMWTAEESQRLSPVQQDAVFELLRIVEVFATAFDELPALIPGRADYRILITTGVLVPRLAVVGQQLVADNAIELIELDAEINAGVVAFTEGGCVRVRWRQLR